MSKQRKRSNSRSAGGRGERAAEGRFARTVRRIVLATLFAGTVATLLPVGWLALRPPLSSAFMVRSFLAEDPATGLACERVHYRWVERGAIAPSLRRAVVIAEDQRFLEHNGFDFKQLRRVLAEREASSGNRSRGASTITQQTAKNLLLWPGRSWMRKGLEAWYAGWFELLLPKQRILELYLNVAQFAPCVFGAEAGAQHHFGRAAAALEDEQAALLAAVLPNPARLRATEPGPWVRERSTQIARQLREKKDAIWLRGI